MLARAPRVVVLLAAIAALHTSACDKLRPGKGGDGGASSAGGGLLSSFFGSDFEGEISMKLSQKNKTAHGGPQQIVFGVKKPKYRIDTSRPNAEDPMAAGSLILDLPTKKGYVLIHPKKMAMVLDFEKMKNMPKGQSIPGLPGAPKTGHTGPPPEPPKIEKTGKKDVVAGYTCEIWNITSEGKRTEICAAEGITWIDLGDLGMSSPELAAAAALSDMNHFPLRVITFDAKGAEDFRMEATKIDKKKLPDAEFAPPPDYRVVDMAQLMGGFPGVMPSGFPPVRSTRSAADSPKGR